MEVRSIGRSVEVIPFQQEGLEECLSIRREVVDGLVLTRHLLRSSEVLFPWSLKQDSHARTRDVVVALEFLPPLQLEGSGCVEEAKVWLQLVELPPDDDLLLAPLQPFLSTVTILEHLGCLLDSDLRVPEDPALP